MKRKRLSVTYLADRSPIGEIALLKLVFLSLYLGLKARASNSPSTPVVKHPGEPPTFILYEECRTNAADVIIVCLEGEN